MDRTDHAANCDCVECTNYRKDRDEAEEQSQQDLAEQIEGAGLA